MIFLGGDDGTTVANSHTFECGSKTDKAGHFPNFPTLIRFRIADYIALHYEICYLLGCVATVFVWRS